MHELALAPRNDIDALAERYARDGVVRIERLFPDATAEAIHRTLARHTPWHLVHSDADGRQIIVDPADWNARPPAAQQAVLDAVMSRARAGFAYLYCVYPMITRYLEGANSGGALHAMVELLNGPDMQGLVKRITNEPNVRKLDAQATLYQPGHFLNTHDDRGEGAERRAAYVMGFSKSWRPDWGGQLLFHENGRTTDGFSPSFNTLTLFRVPRQHIVTQVSTFAGAGRYSITGWLRSD